jgi:hypothetical protein
MAELPSAGWRDFATERDIDAERAEFRREMAELRREIKREVVSMTRIVICTNIGCMLGFGGIVLAAVKLA